MFKKQLVMNTETRNASVSKNDVVIERLAQVTLDVCSSRFAKKEVQREVVAIFSEKRPPINNKTRPAYKRLIEGVCNAIPANYDLRQRARKFAKEHGIPLEC